MCKSITNHRYCYPSMPSLLVQNPALISISKPLSLIYAKKCEEEKTVEKEELRSQYKLLINYKHNQ